VSGPLWLPIGVDKRTGQMRPPIANLPARLHSGEGIGGTPGTLTQVVNNFVSVQGNFRPESNRSLYSNETIQNVSDANINPQGPSLPLECPVTVVPDFPLGSVTVKDVLKQWVSKDPSKNVITPLMHWNSEERNVGRGGREDKQGNRKRKRNYSRRKVIAISFFHAISYMTLHEYESNFTSIAGTGNFKKNYSISVKYIKDKNLDVILKNQERWINLCSEHMNTDWVKNALGL